MKHLLLTLALIVIPAICTAGRWVKIDSQNGSTFYIHTDIKTENGNYLVWIKTTYDSEEARQDVKKQYNTQKSIVNTRTYTATTARGTSCASRKYRRSTPKGNWLTHIRRTNTNGYT